MEQSRVTWHRWEDMPKERVTDLLERRLITGDRMMLSHVYLRKGCVVPRHAHDNEQFTYILEDTLDVDVFSPPRQDWLDNTDDYLRRK